MPKNKQEQEAPNPESLLEEKVDAMMDPKRPDATAAKTADQPKTAGAELPPLDIFAGAQGAPEVSKGLLTEGDIPGDQEDVGAERVAAGQENEEPATEPVDLDDPTIDAAVDDIEQHEDNSDLEVATEDAERAVSKSKKIHHHPVFWTLIVILVVIAIVTAVLLITGGDLTFPGADKIQGWLSSIRK